MNGLEKCISFQIWLFWVSMLKFLGVSCFLGSKSVFGVHFQVPSQFLRVVMLMGQGSLIRSIWNEWLVAIFGNASTPLLD